MTFRGLIREIKDFPATMIVCACWALVFAAMVGAQIAAGAYPSWQKWLVLGIGDGHRFGDLTLDDLARGEYWRLITSTFIHFSVIHLVLNLMAMYQIGTLIESWYGSHQFVFVYGLTGGGGNLVSALIRHEIGASPRIHSGGGSVVIMGLVGLCAVAGLRSRKQTGIALGRIMLFFMALTAAIGIALPRFIDNWGHAGGAVVGIALGFGHAAMLRSFRRPSAWGRGVLTALIIAGCGAAQVMADRREAPARAEQDLLRRLAVVERNYQALVRTERLVRQGADGTTILRWLKGLNVAVESGQLEAGDLRRLRELASAAAGRRFSENELRELRERLARSLVATRSAFAAARNKLWELRADPRRRPSR
jgi:membrane associated rhomboid family serine protease